ncbi:MAG: malonic semialdehyde reductase [Alphaproteobacteria bacterium GWC2_42_16]|nr:MAG: malonic semialdehyde reductase [Alphaproteobacteria bacterium GWC2_42_16]OFW73654.1 MAG: malonic semialdehyde reductase [Alphaproteobacteria bacterium GWA2_41_27]OFW81966.1 MAG: malonic semialdehyde reductase [Alphaproteobacteria bacterium RIFCSPHIGHO2_12_FULL_42_100]OFW85980.1 MAG: malonic semialdehyde reductase [Alphaproteobacteria bacterium RBG_16_42_14]OFW91102.1 MAG: malonic semialdehyde reductase [Alphaproteobacteria bacterium RIFCSPHIGHO2_02_FULL_42_30]OFW93590.1 MAG: malonic se
MGKIAKAALNQIFKDARTYSKWFDKPVSEELLHTIYDLMKLGPTSANCCPLRIVFVRSKEAKERLRPHLNEGNVAKTMSAPLTAILGYDLQFYEHLPFLYPYVDAKSWFEGKEDFAQETAFRNSTLQGAYFIIAARACGLDCGPMSGFSNQGVDKEFFPEGRFKSNFLCNLGYGDPSGLRGPRSPRLSFDQACQIL